MLYSAMKSSPLQITSKERPHRKKNQKKRVQNGPILDLQGALFLAKCLSFLAYTYNKKVEMRGKSPLDFQVDIYDETLKEMLEKFSKEDSRMHGRLIELKEYLLWIDANVLELNCTQIKQFNLNDYKVFNQIDGHTSFATEQVRVEMFRKKYLYYGEWEKERSTLDSYWIRTDRLRIFRRDLLKSEGCFNNDFDYKNLNQYFSDLDRELREIICQEKSCDQNGQILLKKSHSLTFLEDDVSLGLQALMYGPLVNPPPSRKAVSQLSKKKTDFKS